MIEVIDLRSLYPYDWQAVKASIQRTRRVLFVNEDTEVTNFGEHLAYRATQELFLRNRRASARFGRKKSSGHWAASESRRKFRAANP